MPSHGKAAEQKADRRPTEEGRRRHRPVDPDNQTQLISGTAKRVLVITQDSDAPKKGRAFNVGSRH